MKTDLFEIWTDPNDPTHVEMRRLSTWEAHQLTLKAFEELADSFAKFFTPRLEELVIAANELANILPIDEKLAARQRSKEDLNRKRKELIKRRR